MSKKAPFIKESWGERSPDSIHGGKLNFMITAD
jgi:hypothetical protein